MQRTAFRGPVPTRSVSVPAAFNQRCPSAMQPVCHHPPPSPLLDKGPVWSPHPGLCVPGQNLRRGAVPGGSGPMNSGTLFRDRLASSQARVSEAFPSPRC